MPSGGDYTTQTQPYVEKILARAKEFDGGGGQLSTTGGSSGSSSGGYQEVMKIAHAQVGKQYVWGAKGPNTFDCSGLVSWSYRAIGVNLEGATYTQIQRGTEVSVEQAQPGDLVFSNFSGNGPEHVALYAGNGRVVEAQSPETGVIENKMPSGKVVIKHIDVAKETRQ